MPDRPRSPAGDWTDTNGHDPGITMLELFAFSLLALMGVVILGRWRSRRNVHCRVTSHAS